jgi:hypothetical protein
VFVAFLKADMFQKQQRKLFMQEIRANANAAELQKIWNLTILFLTLAAAKAMPPISSCFVSHATEANQTVAIVKSTTRR